MITIDGLIAEGKNFKFKNCKMYDNEGRVKDIIQNMFYLPEEEKYNAWIIRTIRYLKTNHTKDYSTQSFIDISNKDISVNNTKKLITILESLKEFPNMCPTILESVPHTVVNVSQHQQQTITVSVCLEAIKNELTGSQLKEIKQIIEEEKDPQMAKPKIIEKIKTFGDAVLTNVIANIITNPAIWRNF